jgi:hypothetical protein
MRVSYATAGGTADGVGLRSEPSPAMNARPRIRHALEPLLRTAIAIRELAGHRPLSKIVEAGPFRFGRGRGRTGTCRRWFNSAPMTRNRRGLSIHSGKGQAHRSPRALGWESPRPLSRAARNKFAFVRRVVACQRHLTTHNGRCTRPMLHTYGVEIAA